MQRKIAENFKGLALEPNSKKKKEGKNTVQVIIAVAFYVTFSDWTYNGLMYRRKSLLPIFFPYRISFRALEILEF